MEIVASGGFSCLEEGFLKIAKFAILILFWLISVGLMVWAILGAGLCLFGCFEGGTSLFGFG